MRYLDFRRLMNQFAVFSLADIRQADPSFHRRRLNEWQDRGYIRKVIKGYYVFSETALNEQVLFAIANRIYAPSYVSLEMALAYYGLIPESVYGITSVATRKTMRFATSIGKFSYRTVQPKLYFGYDFLAGGIKIASPEKALLDYVYLHPDLRTREDFAHLRFDREALAKIDRKKLDGYAVFFSRPSSQWRIRKLREYMDHA